MLKDLSNTTEAELDAMSVDAEDGEGNIVLDADNYWEEGGLRFFKRPLKVDFGLWAFFLDDRSSLIADRHSDLVYAFAMSVSHEFNEKLAKIAPAGYACLPGYPNFDITFW